MKKNHTTPRDKLNSPNTRTQNILFTATTDIFFLVKAELQMISVKQTTQSCPSYFFSKLYSHGYLRLKLQPHPQPHMEIGEERYH